MANKKTDMDWGRVIEMLKAQCKTVDIARALGISTDKIYVRCQQDLGIDFSALKEEKRSEGQNVLRFKQYEIALTGNVPMLIWLGKQYLGQTDKSEVESTLKGSGLKIGFEDDSDSKEKR